MAAAAAISRSPTGKTADSSHGEGAGAGQGSQELKTVTSPPRKLGVAGARFPREGPRPGSGRVQVMDRVIFEATVSNVEPPGTDAPVGLGGLRKSSVASRGGPTSSARNSARSAGQGRRGEGFAAFANAAGETGSASESPRSSVRGGKEKTAKNQLSLEERRQAEIRSKFEKTDAARERDRRAIGERVDLFKEQREERFKRLLEEVTGRDNLAYTLALEIREREAHQQNRQRELHAAWEEKVYQPIASQAYDRMNPPNRAEQQRLQGSKNVSFDVPGKTFRLRASVDEDPVRKSLVDNARENAFHQAATAVLNQSRSAPNLSAAFGRGGSWLPKALSRPVLEPMSWGQVAIQGTIYGQFAQVCDGPDFRRTIRGGQGAHLPDESDNVPSAGTRKGADGTFNDKGILRGDIAAQGSTSELKTALGASSAAPGQDHYTYAIGPHVTKLEYPPGKRMVNQTR